MNTEKTSPTIALLQMKLEEGDKAANLAHAEDMIAEAAAQHADIALLPECMDLGWTHPEVRNLAEPIPDGGPCRRLMQAAQRHGLYICSGLTERDGDRVYNSAVLIDSQGRLLARHRKLNELKIAWDCYDKGDRLNCVDTPFGRIGLMICADGFAKDRLYTRSLGLMGAEFILSPSAWAVPADHDNQQTPYWNGWIDRYTPAAKEFGMTIFGVSNVGPMSVGPWAGRLSIGCSLGISGQGDVIIKGPYGADAECILYTEFTRFSMKGAPV